MMGLNRTTSDSKYHTLDPSQGRSISGSTNTLCDQGVHIRINGTINMLWIYNNSIIGTLLAIPDKRIKYTYS